MDAALTMLLASPTPSTWLASHLAARYDEHADDSAAATADDCESRWSTVADLLLDDAAILRSMHRRLVDEERVPAAAAATYIAGWTAGTLADAVGFGLATAAAGFVVDAAHIRWRQHPDGWMERVDLAGCNALVAAGHPWADCDGVEIVADDATVQERAVMALVELVTPLIDACHSLTRVGRAGLWNEVADGLGMAVSFQWALPTHPDAVDALTSAVRVPGVPWKARPEVRIVEHPVIGPVYVGHKGGCCLAYTRQRDEAHEPPDDEMTEEQREYLARFPVSADQPRYCSTCTFRDTRDVEARQLFWLERHHAKHTATNEPNKEKTP